MEGASAAPRPGAESGWHRTRCVADAPRRAQVYLEEGITSYDKRKLGFFITTAEAEAQLQQARAIPSCTLRGALLGADRAPGHPRRRSLRIWSRGAV